ncbi:MAG: hypothetical protein J6W13_04810 [Salinivirgaceae bacterium]|nr:hypothetical protein [Salinivirgaceae bacterium]
MKTVKLGGSLLMAAALFSSCIEQSDVEMHTTINSDGTCTRIVSYSDVMSQEMRDTLWTDSSQRRAQPVPECLDISGYTYSFTQVGKGDTVTSVLTHDYGTVAEMSEDMPLQLNGAQLKASSSFAKRFRWFYTDYTFTEVFSSVADNFLLPISDYVEDDVASFWFTGQPEMLQGLSGAELAEQINPMESAVTNWLNDNIFKLSFDFIVSHYDSISNPPISREQFVAQHDSFKEYVMKQGDGDVLSVDHKKIFKNFFHSDAYAFFFDETPCGKLLEKENAKLLNIFNLSVPYTIAMPGHITDAGTGVCQNDTVFYSLTGERLIPHDYTITASSRVNHVWAYIVTVLVVVLASVFVLYRRS